MTAWKSSCESFCSQRIAGRHAVSAPGADPQEDSAAARRHPTRWLAQARRQPLSFALVMIAVLLLTALDTQLPDNGPRYANFDFYQRWDSREHGKDSVIVLEIDDASLAALGQWPWPRSTMARVIERLAALHPAAIGIDIIFPEPDRLSPRQQSATLARSGYTEAAQYLAALPDYDQQLAEAIHAAPVILGMSALPDPPNASAETFERDETDPLRFVPHYASALRSIEVIDRAAQGHGLLVRNPEDQVIRRIPAISRIDQDVLPSLPLEILRILAGEPALRIDSDAAGVKGLNISDRYIPTDRDGGWWLDYGAPLQATHPSAAELMEGKIPPDLIADHIVLIGATATAVQDVVATPLGPIAGVDTLAQALNNFFDERLLSRPRWAPWAEGGLLALLSLLMVMLVPALRPIAAGGILLALLAACLAGGIWLFQQHGLLLDIANPAIGATLVFAVTLSLTLSETRAQRSRLRKELADSHIAQARMEGELDAARRIQMGMLPEPQQVLGNEGRVGVAARMVPARSVGGDLYDFFLLDPSHLFLLVGDVSGKGLPASLFMALSKALTKGAALRSNADPGRALRDAGAVIAEENTEQLFVTVLAAVIDLDSGRCDWCSAGHEPPWLLPASGAAPYRLVTRGGPPLCVVDGYDYRSETLQLARGDGLCLLTDGIGDAQDISGAFFGQQRVFSCLSRLGPGTTAQTVVETLLGDTLTFSGSAEPADDLTILALRWHGPSSTAPLTIETKVARM
jgi:serine phosphatase RsbU (regulator of sigma subunit)/CHASE2 domain-containing sensor protein